MTLKDRLLKRLPKKYHDRVVDLVAESDLIGGCKYLVYYSSKYTDGEVYGGSYPVVSISDAIYFIKNCLY